MSGTDPQQPLTPRFRHPAAAGPHRVFYLNRFKQSKTRWTAACGCGASGNAGVLAATPPGDFSRGETHRPNLDRTLNGTGSDHLAEKCHSFDACTSNQRLEPRGWQSGGGRSTRGNRWDPDVRARPGIDLRAGRLDRSASGCGARIVSGCRRGRAFPCRLR